MPRKYRHLDDLLNEKRSIRYAKLKAKGYSPAIARRLRDWGIWRYYLAIKRRNPRIKAKPGEGVTFWREYEQRKARR